MFPFCNFSTVSSIVNSLAAIIVEDYVKKWKPNLSEAKLTLISKEISVVTGLLGFGFVFIAERMGSIFSVIGQSTIFLLNLIHRF
jgi:Na+/proline symporter